MPLLTEPERERSPFAALVRDQAAEIFPSDFTTCHPLRAGTARAPSVWATRPQHSTLHLKDHRRAWRFVIECSSDFRLVTSAATWRLSRPRTCEQERCATAVRRVTIACKQQPPGHGNEHATSRRCGECACRRW